MANRDGVLALLLLATLGVLVLVSAPLRQQCTCERRGQHGDAKTQQGPGATPPNTGLEVGSDQHQEKSPGTATESEEKALEYAVWGVWINSILAFFTLLIAGTGIYQAWIARDTAKRQLRAYVMVNTVTVFNVADPRPLFPGQRFDPPTAAQRTNTAAGAGTLIEIKNLGQTPASNVVHWGNIVFGDVPLRNELPPIPNISKMPASILGPGVTSSKFLEMRPAMTEQQEDSLRKGTGALYVYGAIEYIDAFGVPHKTRYRLMHHASGGAIGVNVTCVFCIEGNSAD